MSVPHCSTLLLKVHLYQCHLSQAQEKSRSYPTWGLVVCVSLVVMAILPVPVVLALRYFNLLDESAGGFSSVSYRKGRVIKDSSAPDDDNASLLNGKLPCSEAPSPVPGSIYRKQSTGLDADITPNGRYGIGYLMANMPDMPESDL